MKHKTRTHLGGPLGPHRDRANAPRGLAARLIAARLRRGLSQARAASELGVGMSTWARWELGKQPRGLYAKAVREWLKSKGGDRGSSRS